jgi:hypothetical protein
LRTVAVLAEEIARVARLERELGDLSAAVAALPVAFILRAVTLLLALSSRSFPHLRMALPALEAFR